MWFHPPEDNKNNAFICCRGFHSAPSIDAAFMAVVFLIGILGQPFELFNRAPVPLVEKEKEICLCLRVCVIGSFCGASLLILFFFRLPPGLNSTRPTQLAKR